MRILLSVFACSPKWGSEPGVGWHWATELARHHEVTLITHSYFADHFRELPSNALPANMRIEYVNVAPPLGQFHEQLLNSQAYYLYWQWFAYKHARKLTQTQSFDLIHHLTLGTFRYPIFMGFLGLPLAVGPIGGGERAPHRFYANLPLRERLKEVIRDLVIHSFWIDPIAQLGLSKATAIYCRTSQTRDSLPNYLRKNTVIANEIGAPQVTRPAAITPKASSSTFHALFAGRLLGWKGAHLAIHAINKARHKGVDVHLTIIGSGPLASHLKSLAKQLNVSRHITFLAQIPQPDLFSRYEQADVFLFPSLHDSGGTVVLEALSRGVPVICLDLGGPAEFINKECGTIIPTKGLSMDEVTTKLGNALIEHQQLAPASKVRMREAAYRQAETLNWQHQVNQVYGDLIRRLHK
jgi:glycosyltransferase involved in cell wall biosynthesis